MKAEGFLVWTALAGGWCQSAIVVQHPTPEMASLSPKIQFKLFFQNPETGNLLEKTLNVFVIFSSFFVLNANMVSSD